MKVDLFQLKNEAEAEVYTLIDQNLRPLPKNADGTINGMSSELYNNDVDALRHAYVSGVFTIEYSESVADILGRLYELFPIGVSTESPENIKKETNMDLWNNFVGRKYGKNSKNKDELFKKLIQALKDGELIIDIDDPRKYKGASSIKKRPKGLVIVIEESETGENLTFYDLDNKQVLNKNDFITSIKNGSFPDYEIRNIGGKETPVSKKDRFNFNNLG